MGDYDFVSKIIPFFNIYDYIILFLFILLYFSHL